ncbi:hypothetical protein HPB50_002505 [Hyalomma asiaticum]|uniref:Uncharacterized protein n=1 Tax=Hyalomma asiaticum TaxID=266040 RepID=A0ACB7SAN3_HYAAI|nr:hypothetical protein HPB50_002505 [Hyalomma asiaticum]
MPCLPARRQPTSPRQAVDWRQRRAVGYSALSEQDLYNKENKSGLPGNEAACASVLRAPPCSDRGNSSLTRYRDIFNCYRTWRRLYPEPARGLSKADERLLRRLQTFLRPAVARHFNPGICGTGPFTSWLRGLPLIPFPNPYQRGAPAQLLGARGHLRD